MALSHRRLVDIDQLFHDIGKIDWATIHVKRTGFGLSARSSVVFSQLQESIEVFDRFPNRVAPFLISFVAQREFERPTNQRNRALEIVRDTASNGTKLISRRLGAGPAYC